MKARIDFDARLRKPVIELEPQDEGEELSLRLLAASDNFTVRLLLDEEDATKGCHFLR